jgi:hypothetical protein
MNKPEFPEGRIGREGQVPLPKSKHEFRENLSWWEWIKYDFGFKTLEELGYDS